jgi:iron complex outermembrane recepter protein
LSSGVSTGAGTPRYRASWSNSFTIGDATITGIFYYTSGIYMSAPDALGPGTERLCISTDALGNNLPASCSKPSLTYFGLTGDFKLTPDVSLSAAILNLFDRKAPFGPIDYAGVNYNPTYDQAGAIERFFSLGLKVRF